MNDYGWAHDLLESEPYVDLTAVVKGGTRHLYFGDVRGISMKDGVLTFEDRTNRLYFIPDVSYWYTDAAAE